MRLINSSFEILEQSSGIEGIYKQIELAGRTCYKSLDKITEDSAKGFVDRMIKSQHYAMLEHGTVYLTIVQFFNNYHREHFVDYYRSRGITESDIGNNSINNYLWRYRDNKYSEIVNKSEDGISIYYITTNLRVLVENGWLDDLKYLCEPTEYHAKRITVRFTTSNGIMREFTRHRSHSFAVESTRYCNYSKEKFNNELVFVEPSWFNKDNMPFENWNHLLCKATPLLHCTDYDVLYEVPVSEYENGVLKRKWCKENWFIHSLQTAELAYLESINDGAKPQEAREVLPLATKCDMVMTGFVSDWQHFFRLRTSIIAETGKPHPDASALADPLYKEFITRGYMEPLV